MPRENSFSDSDGRSLTPDLEEEFGLDTTSPIQTSAPVLQPIQTDVPRQHAAGRPSVDAKERPSASVRIREVLMQSPTRNPQSATSERSHRPQMTPGDKFRATVRKIIAMRRGSVAMSRGRIGAEPGVDPRRESAYLTYGHIRQQCLIEIVDYSSVRSSFGRMTNQEFIGYLADDAASRKEPWAKVRWINVGGVSWDVVSALALKYDMHPLALEDVLHFRKNARSKADYYMQHLFLRILCHTICSDEEYVESTPDSSFTNLPRSSSPTPMELDDEESYDETKDKEDGGAMYGMEPNSRFTSRTSTLRNTVRRRMSRNGDVESRPAGALPASRSSSFAVLKGKDARNAKIIKALKKGERVNVKISPMCIFLFRDGTVITIHKDNKLNFTAPITERLRQRDTGLRTTADASLLVESLVDLVVDQALEVVEEYQSKILKLEQAVLLKAEMKHVRRLHILQGDLILHKRTMEPIKTVIYGLRRYDVDRVAALMERVDPSDKVQGYMSHKAKIYLADVHDHMEYILSSLDMFANVSENLINYTFNMSSYEMNEVMRRLTLATIIFLPLTLLTGYFGMNFNVMWSVQQHSDVLFWIIALPVMAIVIPMFIYSDLERMFHYLKKRMTTHSVKQKYKQA